MHLKNPLIAALLLAAPLAQAQQIVPADPVQFERVSLRQVVDDCMFDPDRVQVTMEGTTIHVRQGTRQCFAPGQPAVVDIQLGAFPPGDYTVAIHPEFDQPATQRVDFRVGGLVVPAVYPPFPVPLANYTGIWWKASESGWGLSLHQGRMNTLVGSIYVFDAAQQPEWFTLGGGQWTSATRWQGELYRSRGPSWGAAQFDPAQVTHQPVGTAVLDFGMVPGTEDSAQFSYTVGGTTVTKTISRVRF